MPTPSLPHPQDDDFVKDFIMAQPPPPPEWGPPMERELRDRLTAAGFKVTTCRCFEEHPVVQLRMRCAVEVTTKEVVRCIRAVAENLSYRLPRGGMTVTATAGRCDGGFVMERMF